MKKIIFLLLLAQTISFLYADCGCQKHYVSFGIKAAQPAECYCNCARYGQAHGKCLECGHKRVPIDLKFATPQPIKTNPVATTT